MYPELKPYIGYNGVLVIEECVNFKDDFFANKADSFINWYDEYTPKHFDGLTDEKWNNYIGSINVQLTVINNYGRYSNLGKQRIFYEISELFGEIVEKGLKR